MGSNNSTTNAIKVLIEQGYTFSQDKNSAKHIYTVRKDGHFVSRIDRVTAERIFEKLGEDMLKRYILNPTDDYFGKEKFKKFYENFIETDY